MAITNGPSIEIVIPVLDEEVDLPVCIERLIEFCSNHMSGYDWTITTADNGSTDRTLEIATELSDLNDRVGFIRLEERGRGRALKRVWTQSKADMVAYMDVDLSTGLDALPRAADIVRSRMCDIAVGSRLIKGSQVTGRSIKREFISRSYSLLFRAMFFVSFRDAQCGFKVVSGKVVKKILPLVKSNGWFFDTELLLLSEKNGYSVCEIPVRWTDDSDTRVKIFDTAWEDIKGLIRIRFGGLARARKILSRK